jgi:hypothetical protein
MEKPGELSANADVQQIKAEISENQAEIQQTVAEIQDRLSPAYLKEQAATTVRDATIGVRDATIGKVQHMMSGNNQIPYALIGIGAAWLLANRRSPDYQWNSYGNYGSGQRPWRDDRDRADYRDPETSSTGEWQKAASEKAEELTDSARRVAYQARNRWDSMLDHNPMAIGIAALAAGALIGASLPQTDVENQYLGETRDQLVDSAREVAQDAVEKVTGNDPV